MIVYNRLCKRHDEIIMYRPSKDPRYAHLGMIEFPKCKCGCWETK